MGVVVASLVLGSLTPAPFVQEADFHQGVDYRIEAVLDESDHTLHAKARLRYTNRSAGSIDTLWVHQHLNAFRPNSAWARRELRFNESRFQDLGASDYAYERFRKVTVGGAAVAAVYPGAPDSTVAALPLPEPLRPGGTVVVEMEWDARLSTTPRRQGRRGRHYDFAQWYPRIAVYDAEGWHPHPLLPQGEFFGEFASYDVTLDLADDQIVAGTGVPVEGDPGWGSVLGPVSDPVRYQRNAYPEVEAESLGLLAARPGEGRKHVRWRAEDVHHFAWSADPDFMYEGGQHHDIAIHVLYLRSDEEWDSARVVGRAARALSWLEGKLGEYAYPQLTILHRLDAGGTEFPMLVMNGGSSQGLITHEVTHQYAHAILANNEWRDAWLDEGLTSFLASWFFEDHGEDGGWPRTMEFAASWPSGVQAQPVATPSADFVSFQTYALMSYTKASIVFRMLREYLGDDTFRQALRTYYARHKLSHVDERDLRRAAEDVSGEELGWFFEQWFHTSATLDYGLGDIVIEEAGEGWVTRVEVFRAGDAWMPVTLEVGGELRHLDSQERLQHLEVVTRVRPSVVEIDPERNLLDSDLSNNRRKLSP